MTRIGRIKFTETDGWYHLYSRLAVHKIVYPLLGAVPMGSREEHCPSQPCDTMSSSQPSLNQWDVLAIIAETT